MIGIIGKKLGMTQIFRDDGELVAVTAVEAGPCPVVGVRTPERDGYSAVQLGYGKAKRVNKPLRGIFEKAGCEPTAMLREFRVDNPQDYKVGDTVDVGIFKAGEKVKVSGRSKGRGFAGVVKRWGFGGGKSASHGFAWNRRPGAISAGADPGRVWKGKKLPGRMGGVTVTIRGIEVVDVDPERNLILLKGSVPGPRNGYLLIEKIETGEKDDGG